MAISHFIITSLPEDVISKIGISNVEVNTQYDIAMEGNLTFQRIAELEGFFLTSKMKFKAYDVDLGKYGNEASVDLIWKESDLANRPLSANSEILWINDQSGNFLDLLSINQATEFIEVISTEGVKNLSLIQGLKYSPQELLKILYTVKSEGGGFPYYILNYKVGRNDILEAEEYSLTINVESIAEIALTDDFVTNTTVIGSDDLEYDVINHFGQFEISQGYQGSTAQIQIDIACPFLTSDPANAESEVLIEINGVLNVYTADEIINTSVLLNSLGKAEIKVHHKIVTDVDNTGTTTITLLSINNDANIVSPTNNSAVLNSNF